MKTIRLLLAAAFAAAAASAARAADAKTPEDVKPLPHYAELARRLADIIPACHVTDMRLDDGVSAKAWTNLLSSYDATRCIFLKSDIESMEPMRTRIDDAMRAGDVSFGFDVYRAYVRNLRDCMDFVTNTIAGARFEFPEGEKYQIQRKDAEWPADDAARRELWTKRIKNEILAQALTRRLDAEERESKKPSGGAATNAVSAFRPDSPEFLAESVEIARTNLLKRYRQFAIITAEPDEDAIMQNFVNSVASAYDPHTAYMSPASNEDFEQSMSLTLCGVGAVLQFDDGALKISEVMKGGPMERDRRIKRGDRIVGVGQGETKDVEDIMYRPMNKTIRKIRGPKGTKVTLEIIPRSDPSGASRKLITLVRDEIKLEDEAATGRVERVECGGRSVKLGYIVLPSFYGTMGKSPDDEGYRSCTDDVRRELAKLESQDVEGLVLDLRGNGGGSLREAVTMMSAFIRKGPVVQVREANRLGVLQCGDEDMKVFDKPMAVLIDRASASASEIVAAALQDYGRAVVIGDDQSHGKGTVQTVLPLGDPKFGALKVTTARFYRVNGSSTQVKGVKSDIVLPSVLGELDIGEDKLPGALPWTRVGSASYRKAWNMRSYLKPLRAASAARLAGNSRWDRHMKAVHCLRDSSKRVFVPIGCEERLALMRKERLVRNETDGDTAGMLLPDGGDGSGGRDDDDGDDGDGQDDVQDGDGGEDVQDGGLRDPQASAPEAAPRRRRSRRRMTTIPEKDDIVLQEALRVLADLVELNGGATMPVRTRRHGLADRIKSLADPL